MAVGDAVNVGQTLATLDGASLQMAIDAQQAAVDQANLVLAKRWPARGDTSSLRWVGLRWVGLRLERRWQAPSGSG